MMSTTQNSRRLRSRCWVPSICHKSLQCDRSNRRPGSGRFGGRCGVISPRRSRICCTVDTAGHAHPSATSAARIFFAPHRPWRLPCNATIVSSTSALVCNGLDCGRRDRGTNPANPSTSKRPNHSYNWVFDTPNVAAARRTDIRPDRTSNTAR